MKTSHQDIRELMERGGIKFKEQDDGTFLVGFSEDSGDLILGLNLVNDWLSLTVTNFLPEISSENMTEVCKQLLNLNTQISYCKSQIYISILKPLSLKLSIHSLSLISHPSIIVLLDLHFFFNVVNLTSQFFQNF